MRSSQRLRRALAVPGCAGLVSALTWLPAGPASAMVTNTFVAVADASSNYTGTDGFTCNLTSGADSASSTSTQFSSGATTKSVDLDATFTSGANPSDITTATGHFKGSLSVSKHHGDLASFKLTGSGSATISHTLGSASQCQTSAFLAVEATTRFSETGPGWLYVHRQTGRAAESVFFAINESTDQLVLLDQFAGGASRSTERAFLTPATYNVPEWFVGVDSSQTAALRSGTALRTDLASQMTGRFYAAGSAFSGTHGAAARFVRFPGSISCSHHSARLTWKSGAFKVAGGSFFVNGRKFSSVSHPKGGQHVVLRHLSGTADNKITAKLTLRGGGKVSASRAYVPCEG
jgi:hypothetical protein